MAKDHGLKPKTQVKTTAGYIGHIEHVLNGVVPEELREHWIDAASFKYAFEIGSPQGIESLGETIALNGLAYTKSTATFSLIYGERLVTTGLFYLPKNAQADSTVTGKGPLTAGELYANLYHKLGSPFAYVGLIEFSTLRATAISKAPIHSQNIFDHKEDYYAHPPLTVPNAFAAIMGVAADFTQDSPLNDKLTTVLYNNPFETPGEINAHSHILLLNNLVDNLYEVGPSVAQDVLHLFPQAEIASYTLELYPLQDLVDFKSLLV